MCGVTAYIGYKSISHNTIKSTLNALSHRGPDASGFAKYKFGNRNLLLIHNRLKIIDLSKNANQPFLSNSSTLIYNGEIYNYLELKQELLSLGHSFLTKSDTEVVSHSLQEWGTDAFKKFEGMWSLVWFDKRNKRVVISRDRFGEKPLFYFKTSEGIYFSSEIKGLFAISEKKDDFNLTKIKDYLMSGYKSLHKNNQTFFKNIREFPKAKMLIIDEKGNKIEREYWSKKFKGENNFSIKENAEIIKNLIINSVKLRLRSDVPLAFCLSSGVDSNSLIFIAKKIFNYDVQGFSIDSIDKRYSERPLMEKVLGEENIDCIYVKTSKNNFLNKLSKIIEQHDSPLSTISYYLHWNLLEKISEKGFKVSISGTGADEIFSGYYDHYNFYFADVKTENNIYYKENLEYWKKYQLKDIRNPFLQNYNLIQRNRNFRKHIYQDKKKFFKFFTKEFGSTFFEKRYHSSQLRNRMMNEVFHETVPVILKEDDLNSMNFSVENRSPFLDKNLFEFMMTVPTNQLIRLGLTKYLLRQAMGKIVNKKILKQRKKIGFNASISELIDFKLKKNKEFFLDKNSIFDIVNRSSIENLLNKKSFTNSESKFLFNFINAKFFLKRNEII